MEITAKLNGNSWPVKIRLLGNDNYIVTGRGTELRLAIRLSRGIGGGELLIAETNHNRCGCLDPWKRWCVYDIQQYIGIENPVDAATLAAALNYILERGILW